MFSMLAPMVLAVQQSLFGRSSGATAASLESRLCGIRRILLDDESWIDHLPGWVDAHGLVFDALMTQTHWKAASREMYERVINVPRLFATFPDDGPGHPLISTMKKALEGRYGVALDAVSAALYRDGRDSVAMHGDTWARELPMALVAIVSVGSPRRFVLRPVAQAKGPPLYFNVGWGDLLVMGGACQRLWLHGIPKVKDASPRVAIMFRQRTEPFGTMLPSSYHTQQPNPPRRP